MLAVPIYPAPDVLELPPLTDAEMSAVLDATRARRRRAVVAGDVATFRATTKIARAFAEELDARNALDVLPRPVAQPTDTGLGHGPLTSWHTFRRTGAHLVDLRGGAPVYCTPTVLRSVQHARNALEVA